MMRWEYRVVSLRDGTYTQTLNGYGQEGWELVGVVPNVHTVAGPRESGSSLPIPGTLGKLGDAATKWTQPDDPDAPEPGSVVTTLLWVFRRERYDDDDVDWSDSSPE